MNEYVEGLQGRRGAAKIRAPFHEELRTKILMITAIEWEVFSL